LRNSTSKLRLAEGKKPVLPAGAASTLHGADSSCSRMACSPGHYAASRHRTAGTQNLTVSRDIMKLDQQWLGRNARRHIKTAR